MNLETIIILGSWHEYQNLVKTKENIFWFGSEKREATQFAFAFHFDLSRNTLLHSVNEKLWNYFCVHVSCWTTAKQVAIFPFSLSFVRVKLKKIEKSLVELGFASVFLSFFLWFALVFFSNFLDSLRQRQKKLFFSYFLSQKR